MSLRSYWRKLIYAFGVGAAVVLSSQNTEVFCMPPPRQSRYNRAAPRQQPVAPLLEGFARPPQSRSTPSASSSSSLVPGSSSLVPARADGTEVSAYTRGNKRLALAIAADPDALAAARGELEGKIFAASNKGPRAQKWQTWIDIAKAAGYSDPFSLSTDMLYDVSAAFSKAGYRSIGDYLSTAKQEMIIHHGTIPEATHIHIRRITRASTRGQGPANQATELPFLRLDELPETEEPMVTEGPCHPRRLAIIASWWALREIEASNATVETISFSGDTVTFTLPSSKTDTTGRGTSRSLSCTCSSAIAALCPFHNLQRQVAWATGQARIFKLPAAQHPVFPTRAGRAAEKQHVSATVVAIAVALGLVSDVDIGTRRFSGHTFRVTGAMYLASCGIDIWRIQLHCRWGSNAVLRYVKLAPLSGSVALEASLGRDLKHVEKAIIAAKAELAAVKSFVGLKASLQDSLEASLGPDLSAAAGALGKPDVDQILECRSKAWWRSPSLGEVLAQNTARWATGGLHSMRPPLIADVGFDMDDFRTLSLRNKHKTWCGWKYPLSSECVLSVWDNTLVEPEMCPRCFGKKPTGDETASSSGSSQS